jgi:hypothetical protein
MASEVILTTLGPTWWKRNCLTTSTCPDEFLKTGEQSETGRYQDQDRVIALGHMLFALKDCPGLQTFITALKTRDLASTFFELWCANILHTNDFDITLVEESGKKGQDYDLIAEKGGHQVGVEVKSRRGNKILSEKTLRNALNKARKQLPPAGPNIIFVTIPVEWTYSEDVESVVQRSIESFFRSTSRINFVVVMWDRWIELDSGRARASLVRQYENPNPRTQLKLGQPVHPLPIPNDVTPENQPFTPAFW